MNEDWLTSSDEIINELVDTISRAKHAMEGEPDKPRPTYLKRDPHTGTYTALMYNKDDTKPAARLRNVHPPTACALRPCAIHDCPSGHPLTDAPLVWTEDINGSDELVLYRECDHGQLHPDVDAGIYLQSIGQHALLEHTCDGCCTDSEED